MWKMWTIWKLKLRIWFCEGGMVQILFWCFVAGGNNCFALIQQLRSGQLQTSNRTYLPRWQLWIQDNIQLCKTDLLVKGLRIWTRPRMDIGHMIRMTWIYHLILFYPLVSGIPGVRSMGSVLWRFSLVKFSLV